MAKSELNRAWWKVKGPGDSERLEAAWPKFHFECVVDSSLALKVTVCDDDVGILPDHLGDVAATRGLLEGRVRVASQGIVAPSHSR